MSRNYANKKAAKRKPSATPKTQAKKSAGALIYISVGLSLGLFIAFLIYLSQQPTNNSKKLAHPSNPKVENKQTKSALSKNKAAAKSKGKSDQKKNLTPQVPEYEFYTMLPDVEVEVNVPQVIEKKTPKSTLPKADITRQPNKHNPYNKTAVKSSAKTLYQLQVGAFQSKQKAESMKAQLGFMGVQSNVSSNWLSNGKKIYKVRIGPSSDEKKLKLIKVKLKKMNINTFLQKV
jgi:cell division protein FtsN